MKTTKMQKIWVVSVVAGLAWSASSVGAQDSATTNAVPPAANNTTAPQLAYGVPEILRLKQAAVGDDTIIAYIKNSGNSYGLNADQIIYLRQQGVSDAVVSTMLNQPKPGVAVAPAPTVASPPAASTASSGQVSTATVAPTVTYVQTVPTTTYYYSQPYYDPYYYPACGWYPPVSLSFGWYGGGGWHGGGWHGGGGYGGGGHGGGHH